MVWAVYLLAINMLLFVLMALDKRRARRNGWRIPEKTLFALALLGGAGGGLAGMRLFRHKTKKTAFTMGFTGMFFMQVAVVVWLCIREQ